MNDEYPSATTLPTLTCPIFIMHGTKDLTVPFAQGEGLARALPRAEFWRTAWTHNNWSMDVTYWGHIKAFLQKYALLTLPAIPDSSTENN